MPTLPTHQIWVALIASIVVCGAVQAQLPTRPADEMGVSVMNYRYGEPGVMDLAATKFGLHYTVTRTVAGKWPNVNDVLFVRGEFSLLTGAARYSNSSGTTAKGLPDWYGEVRALIGADASTGQHTLSPYIGLGYRTLSSDLRALTNGYRRYSRYLYVPLGVTHKMRIGSGKQLHTTVEYDHLISGRQDAMLRDYRPGNTDATDLKQSKGHGFRISVMVDDGTWSFGPSLNFWSLGPSSQGGFPLVYEPKNNTLELLFNFKYKF